MSNHHDAGEVANVPLFQTVQTQSWTVDSKAAGTWVTSRNLTYAKVSPVVRSPGRR